MCYFAVTCNVDVVDLSPCQGTASVWQKMHSLWPAWRQAAEATHAVARVSSRLPLPLLISLAMKLDLGTK